MAIARIFFGLILIFLFVAFSLKNMGPVSVDLYFRKTPELPLFVWLFSAALFGVIVAWLVAISEQLRMRRELKKERKEKKELEERVERLKKEIAEIEERLSRQRMEMVKEAQPASQGTQTNPDPPASEPFSNGAEVDAAGEGDAPSKPESEEGEAGGDSSK